MDFFEREDQLWSAPKTNTANLVGGLPTPLKKYESKLGLLFPLHLEKQKNMFQTNNLILHLPFIFLVAGNHPMDISLHNKQNKRSKLLDDTAIQASLRLAPATVAIAGAKWCWAARLTGKLSDLWLMDVYGSTHV